jgi:hypothetical protein
MKRGLKKGTEKGDWKRIKKIFSTKVQVISGH